MEKLEEGYIRGTFRDKEYEVCPDHAQPAAPRGALRERERKARQREGGRHTLGILLAKSIPPPLSLSLAPLSLFLSCTLGQVECRKLLPRSTTLNHAQPATPL